MLFLAAISLVLMVLQILTLILPEASFWPLPDGVTAAFSTLGDFVATAAAFLPDGVASTASDAAYFLLTVFVLCLPWAIVRALRLPMFR